MMGVYIKGMEMPDIRQAYAGLIIRWDGKVYPFFTPQGYELVESVATAVPVPPHGDLIERDAAYDKIAEQEGGNYVDMDAVDMGLNETPVIIPAEECE